MNTVTSRLKSFPERKTGRPRRQDNYEKVSFTISTALLTQVDQRAQKWGMNRSGAVARIVQAQINNASSDKAKYQDLEQKLIQSNKLLNERRAG